AGHRTRSITDPSPTGDVVCTAPSGSGIEEAAKQHCEALGLVAMPGIDGTIRCSAPIFEAPDRLVLSDRECTKMLCTGGAAATTMSDGRCGCGGAPVEGGGPDFGGGKPTPPPGPSGPR